MKPESPALVEVLIPHCPRCLHFMHGHDFRIICRKNGLAATPANADGCKLYVRDPGSDDEPMEWRDGAWHVAGEGRGD